MNKTFGLLGAHVEGSFSPFLHSFLSEEAYRLYSVAGEGLPAFLKSSSFDGINVTIPYKQTVLPYLDAMSSRAQRIGSVNTILRQGDGKLYGENTDYDGMAVCLDRLGVSLRNRKILILGSGGSSKTAKALVKDRGGSPVIISRKGENHYGNLERHRDAFGIINTTPVGMFPDCIASPVDLSCFDRLSFVFDIVYTPLRTKLLQQAESLTIPHIGGLPMLVSQAAYARKLFDGIMPSEEKIKQAVLELRRRKTNLVLVFQKDGINWPLVERLDYLLRMPIYQSVDFNPNGNTKPASIIVCEADSLQNGMLFLLKMNGFIVRLQPEKEKTDQEIDPSAFDCILKDTMIDHTCQAIKEAYHAFLHSEWT